MEEGPIESYHRLNAHAYEVEFRWDDEYHQDEEIQFNSEISYTEVTW